MRVLSSGTSTAMPARPLRAHGHGRLARTPAHASLAVDGRRIAGGRDRGVARRTVRADATRLVRSESAAVSTPSLAARPPESGSTASRSASCPWLDDVVLAGTGQRQRAAHVGPSPSLASERRRDSETALPDAAGSRRRCGPGAGGGSRRRSVSSCWRTVRPSRAGNTVATRVSASIDSRPAYGARGSMARATARRPSAGRRCRRLLRAARACCAADHRGARGARRGERPSPRERPLARRP